MESIIEEILRTIKGSSPIELLAVVMSILYVTLAARENILCWVAALISSGLFMYIFLDSGLYTKVLLRGYYFVIAIYGFYQWKYGYKNREELPVRTWIPSFHLIAILCCALLGFIVGGSLDAYTEASSPYLDSITTVFSFFVTWLVTRKYLENWIYWIVIDSSSMYLYFSQELYFTTFLYLIFTIMAVVGFFTWRRSYKGLYG